MRRSLPRGSVLVGRYDRAILSGFVTFLFLLFGLAVPCWSETLPVHVADGVLLASEDQGIHGEILTLPDALLEALGAVPKHGSLEVLGLPTAPGERRTIRLQRYSPWADGARLWRIDGNGRTELDKAWRNFYLGSDPSDTRWRVGLWLDPGSGRLGGVTSGPLGLFELSADGENHLLKSAGSRPSELHSSCGQQELRVSSPAAPPAPFGEPAFDVPAAPTPRAAGKGTADPTYQAIVAIDTDNEFHFEKFDNDTTEATTWLEDLFVAMNLAYEPGMDLRLIIGETFFRLDTDPSPTFDDDPWVVASSGASITHLNEFGNYWSANMASVDRAFAALMSGKSSSSTSSSGIAWIDGWCEKQNSGGGYSINQVFTAGFVTPTDDARLVGHEIGHNAGSDHTHCYSPPVDTCYGLESGCYSGSTSCPAGESSGTLMSYCHFGACPNSSRLEFHPTVASLLNGFRSSHYPSCATDFEPPGEIFSDGFESGNTSSWI